MAVGLDDSFIHVAREAKIVRVDDQTHGHLIGVNPRPSAAITALPLEQSQLNPQELFRIGLEILNQVVAFRRVAPFSES